MSSAQPARAEAVGRRGQTAAQAREAALLIENGRLRAASAATTEILYAVAGGPGGVQGALDQIVQQATRLFAPTDARVVVIRDGIRTHEAHAGPIPIPSLVGQPVHFQPSAGFRAFDERRTMHIPDALAADPAEYGGSIERAATSGWRTILCVPLLAQEAAIGLIMLRRQDVRPFTQEQIALVETFAAQAVIAIENARLFAELQERLEEQTATSEVLRVIASSPADLQRVMETVVERMGRLCGASECILWRVDGDRLRGRAAWFTEEGIRFMGSRHPGNPLVRDQIHGRAVLERRTVHVHDLAHPGPQDDVDRAWAQAPIRRGVGTYLATPLLREGQPIGALSITRHGVRPFSDGTVRLIESFADQAVIAIENARLFAELRERDERRAKELERASGIQQRLLPAAVEGWPGLLEIAVRFRPAVETSGDFYDVLRLAPAAEGTLPPLQIAVGDVAGKGMSAALVTALARTALRTTSSVPVELATPANALRLAGRRLHEDVGASHFVACALAVVEPPGLHNHGPLLRLSNAAQVPVLLVRDGAATELAPPGYRLPLGAQPDGAYEDAKIELRPGDAVVFSSDGLVEAPAQPGETASAHLAAAQRAGELFGFERLARSAAHWSAAAGTAEAVAEGIWADVTAWAGEASHHDDMTLLVLRVPEAQR